MLFLTHRIKVENSLKKEFDKNKLEGFENLIFIAIQKDDEPFNDLIELSAGSDKNNCYIIFDKKEIKEEVKNLFSYHNMNHTIDINKNFILIKQLRNHDEFNSAYIINTNDGKETMEYLDNFNQEEGYHKFFKKLGNFSFDITKKIAMKTVV